MILVPFCGQRTMSDPVREQVLTLLNGGHAHVTFDHVIKDFPAKLRGVKPEGAPHTAWQLLEHMRIAQWDSRSTVNTSPDIAGMAGRLLAQDREAP